MTESARITLVAAPGAVIAALQELPVTTVNPADLPSDPDRAAQRVATTGCDVAILGAELSLDLTLGTAACLNVLFPEIDVILLAQRSEAVAVRAMTAGIRQVVDVGASKSDIHDAVVRVAGAAALRRSRLGGEATEEPARAEGRVISVIGAKGGVGKSTVAVNLATELARGAANEVVLIDLDLAAGEIDLLLGIKATASVASVASAGAVVDSALIKVSLTSHPSGLLVLPAPESLVDAEAVDANIVLRTIQTLQASFSYIVIDTAPGAGAELIMAVEASNDVIAVATPDVGGLRSLRRNLDGFDSLGLTARRHLVLNYADAQAGLTNQAIENAADLPIVQAIPHTRAIPVAANQGVPFVLTQPKVEAARAIRALAAALASPSQGHGRNRHNGQRLLGAA